MAVFCSGGRLEASGQQQQAASRTDATSSDARHLDGNKPGRHGSSSELSHFSVDCLVGSGLLPWSDNVRS